MELGSTFGNPQQVLKPWSVGELPGKAEGARKEEGKIDPEFSVDLLRC